MLVFPFVSIYVKTNCYGLLMMTNFTSSYLCCFSQEIRSWSKSLEIEKNRIAKALFRKKWSKYFHNKTHIIKVVHSIPDTMRFSDFKDWLLTLFFIIIQLQFNLIWESGWCLSLIRLWYYFLIVLSVIKYCFIHQIFQ